MGSSRHFIDTLSCINVNRSIIRFDISTLYGVSFRWRMANKWVNMSICITWHLTQWKRNFFLVLMVIVSFHWRFCVFLSSFPCHFIDAFVSFHWRVYIRNNIYNKNNSYEGHSKLHHQYNVDFLSPNFWLWEFSFLLSHSIDVFTFVWLSTIIITSCTFYNLSIPPGR